MKIVNRVFICHLAQLFIIYIATILYTHALTKDYTNVINSQSLIIKK